MKIHTQKSSNYMFLNKFLYWIALSFLISYQCVCFSFELFRDASDSNPRFYDLMLAVESRSALYIENKELSGTSWKR